MSGETPVDIERKWIGQEESQPASELVASWDDDYPAEEGGGASFTRATTTALNGSASEDDAYVKSFFAHIWSHH